jgi:hypothetical protein
MARNTKIVTLNQAGAMIRPHKSLTSQRVRQLLHALGLTTVPHAVEGDKRIQTGVRVVDVKRIIRERAK